MTFPLPCLSALFQSTNGNHFNFSPTCFFDFSPNILFWKFLKQEKSCKNSINTHMPFSESSLDTILPHLLHLALYVYIYIYLFGSLVQKFWHFTPRIETSYRNMQKYLRTHWKKNKQKEVGRWLAPSSMKPSNKGSIIKTVVLEHS